MARLATCGFALNSPGDTSLSPDGQASSGGGGAVTWDSTVQRSGVYSLKCASGAGGTAWGQRDNPTSTLGTTLYLSAWFNFDLAQSATLTIMRWTVGGVNCGEVRLTSADKLQLWNAVAGTQIGSDSIALTASTWTKVALSVLINTGSTDALELQVNGSSVASASGLALTDSVNTPIGAYGIRVNAGSGATNLWVDDVIVNDSTGGNQNTWPGDGKLILLLPTADSAVGTGWTLGTGTAISSNGFGSVDNTPPLGVANVEAGSDPKQIRNAASAANSNYDATMTTYSAAGIAAGDTINVIVPWVSTAAPVSTSAKQGTVGMVSNPTIANIALAADGVSGAFWQGSIEGTFPTGWKWSPGTVTYVPSVTVGTAPVMRITQVTSSTRIATVCFMGIYVDYTPGVATQVPYVNTMPALLAQ
jgi:hypothetical protein